MSKSLIFSFAVILFLAGVSYYVLKSPETTGEDLLITNPTPSPTTPIPTAPSPTPVATGGCYVGGCSNQLCTDQKDVVSTCEYREEYACYKSAKCERQASGQCGWTQTPELAICLSVASGTGSDIK